MSVCFGLDFRRMGNGLVGLVHLPVSDDLYNGM